MLYLETFKFPNDEQEFDFILTIQRKCYETFYPFKILSAKGLERLDFEPITILYGGNGSGKTTALNIIAETCSLKREAVYNRSNFFEDYVKLCRYTTEFEQKIPVNSCIITSDDVFDYMLNIRTLNDGIHKKREEVFEEYLEAKYSNFKMKSLDDYEKLKRVNDSRRKTQSRYTVDHLMENVRERSNGESGFMYFTEKITENGLYLLDEPENSLSPKRQHELVEFIENSARFFGCQFIISTHSPFLLAIKGAKIYNLDEDSKVVNKWTDLKNVRLFYDFFKQHEEKFERL